MGNKLRSMLNHKDENYTLTVHFNNEEEREEFLNAIEYIDTYGKPQKVSYASFIDIKKNINNRQYPLEVHQDIEEIMLRPVSDVISIELDLDTFSDKIDFIRTVSKKFVRLESKDMSLLKINIDFVLEEYKMQLTYKYELLDDVTLQNLVYESKKFVALLDVLLKKGFQSDQLLKTRKQFKQSSDYYQRIMALLDVFSIEVDSKTAINESKPNFVIEEMYLLLVQKKIIKKNDKLNYISTADVEAPRVGQELFASYIDKCVFSFANQNRNFYIVKCVFGAKIKSIEESEDGKKIIYFEEKKDKPMFMSYSAYLTEEEAQYEIDQIIDKHEEYIHAEHFTDQLKKLLEVA